MDYNNLLQKLSLLGYSIEEDTTNIKWIDTNNKTPLYIASRGVNDNIIVIPDNIVSICVGGPTSLRGVFAKIMKQLKIIGGKDIQICRGLGSKSIRFTAPDLSQFNPEHVKDIGDLLKAAEDINTKEQRILRFNLEDLTTADSILSYASIERFDTDDIGTSNKFNNLETLDFAFSNCTAENINIHDIETANLRDIAYMFADTKIKKLTLELDAPNLKTIEGLFYNATIDKLHLNIGSIARFKDKMSMIGKVPMLYNMFKDAIIKEAFIVVPYENTDEELEVYLELLKDSTTKVDYFINGGSKTYTTEQIQQGLHKLP